ncbi:MAG: NfeD family protein [Paucimonas sp.]|jgi:membrane protein implicated in regulation of membrane protease activity|nr:NfeD family protein [Paucimonas sp.]
MADWVIWFVMAGVLVIFEIFTGTFYLLMIACGLAAGGAAALMSMTHSMQLIAAAVVGLGATYALRRIRKSEGPAADASRDPNVNLDIGQSVSIDTWESSARGAPRARAMYRGAMWDIELAQGSEPEAGMFIIREVVGSRLVVANNH